LSLDGPLDVGHLEAAIHALVARHASLRAAFCQEEIGRAVQVIVSDINVPVRRLDLSAITEADRCARLDELLARDCGERFDLTRAPLIRFAVVRLGPRQHRLVMTNHHILMDGWSMPILVRELLTLYAHRGDAALPRATPYRDYLAWLAAQDREA